MNDGRRAMMNFDQQLQAIEIFQDVLHEDPDVPGVYRYESPWDDKAIADTIGCNKGQVERFRVKRGYRIVALPGQAKNPRGPSKVEQFAERLDEMSDVLIDLRERMERLEKKLEPAQTQIPWAPKYGPR